LDFGACLDFAGGLVCAGCLDCAGCAGCFDLDLVTRLVRVLAFELGETLNVETLAFDEVLNLRFFGDVRPESLALELPESVRLRDGPGRGGV